MTLFCNLFMERPSYYYYYYCYYYCTTTTATTTTIITTTVLWYTGRIYAVTYCLSFRSTGHGQVAITSWRWRQLSYAGTLPLTVSVWLFVSLYVSLRCFTRRWIPPVHRVTNSFWLKIPNSAYFTDKKCQIFNNTVYDNIVTAKLMPNCRCQNWALLPSSKNNANKCQITELNFYCRVPLKCQIWLSWNFSISECQLANPSDAPSNWPWKNAMFLLRVIQRIKVTHYARLTELLYAGPG